MRSFIRESVLMIVMATLVGCGSGMGTKPADQAAAPAAAVASTNAWVMQFGGSNVLRVVAAGDSKCVAKEGSLHITGSHGEIEVWLVQGAQTVDAAIAQVPHQIQSEFKNFKVEHTSDLTVAGEPAKRLMGSGDEADDGDPGHADVVVFKVGDHVFVTCAHEENLTPAAREGMLALVQTAQLP